MASAAAAVVSSEEFFDCVSAWHGTPGALEFLATNDGAAALLSSSQIVPQGFMTHFGVDAAASSTRSADSSTTSALKCCSSSLLSTSSLPTIQLVVRTRCCQMESLLSDEERMALSNVQALPDSVKESNDEKSCRAIHSAAVAQASTLCSFLFKAHAKGCQWRGTGPGRALLHPDTLVLKDSLVVRGRCAAVRCWDISSSSSSSAASCGADASTLLFPRGTPPSVLAREFRFSEAVLLDDRSSRRRRCIAHNDEQTVCVQATKAGASPAVALKYIGSSADSRILKVLLSYKRERVDEATDETTRGESSADIPLAQQHIAQNVSMFLRCYGYMINWTDADGDSSSAGEEGEGSTEEARLWRRIGRRIRCRYCSHSPSVAIQRTTTIITIGEDGAETAQDPALKTASFRADFASTLPAAVPVLSKDDAPASSAPAATLVSESTTSTLLEEDVNTIADDPSQQQRMPSLQGATMAEENAADGGQAHELTAPDEQVQGESSGSVEHEEEEGVEAATSETGIDELEALLSPLFASEVQCATRTVTHITYTVTISNRQAFARHCACCPWHGLFLTPLLGESTNVNATLLDLDFALRDVVSAEEKNQKEEESQWETCSKANDGAAAHAVNSQQQTMMKDTETLQLRFFCDEILPLVQSWRRSCQAESSSQRLAYLHNPAPAAVHSSLYPLRADTAVVEPFLAELSHKYAESGQERVTDAAAAGACVDATRAFKTPLYHFPGSSLTKSSAEHIVKVAMLAATSLATSSSPPQGEGQLAQRGGGDSDTLPKASLSLTSSSSAVDTLIKSGLQLLGLADINVAQGDDTRNSLASTEEQEERMNQFRTDYARLLQSDTTTSTGGTTPMFKKATVHAAAAVAARVPALLHCLYRDSLPKIELVTEKIGDELQQPTAAAESEGGEENLMASTTVSTRQTIVVRDDAQRHDSVTPQESEAWRVGAEAGMTKFNGGLAKAKATVAAAASAVAAAQSKATLASHQPAATNTTANTSFNKAPAQARGAEATVNGGLRQQQGHASILKQPLPPQQQQPVAPHSQWIPPEHHQHQQPHSFMSHQPQGALYQQQQPQQSLWGQTSLQTLQPHHHHHHHSQQTMAPSHRSSLNPSASSFHPAGGAGGAVLSAPSVFGQSPLHLPQRPPHSQGGILERSSAIFPNASASTVPPVILAPPTIASGGGGGGLGGPASVLGGGDPTANPSILGRPSTSGRGGGGGGGGTWRGGARGSGGGVENSSPPPQQQQQQGRGGFGGGRFRQHGDASNGGVGRKRGSGGGGGQRRGGGSGRGGGNYR